MRGVRTRPRGIGSNAHSKLAAAVDGLGGVSRAPFTALALWFRLRAEVAEVPVRELEPTWQGTISINASDGEDCWLGCMGDWSGPHCGVLPDPAVVTLRRVDAPADPARTVTTDAHGWADFTEVTPGEYAYMVESVGWLPAEGQIRVGFRQDAPYPRCRLVEARPSADGGWTEVRECVQAVRRPLGLRERPRGSHVEVPLLARRGHRRGPPRPPIYDGEQPRTVFEADVLDHLPH